MYRLFSIFLAIAITGCSGSGVSSGAGGAAGTDTGNTGLLVYSTVTPDTTSVNAGDCIIDGDASGSLGAISITVQDKSANPLFQQGVTFDSYTVTYSPTSSGAPALSSRTFHSTIPIPLNGSSAATASQSIVLVDAKTLREFRGNSGATGVTYTYTISVSYYGRDWVHQEAIRVVTNTQIQIGDYCPKPEPTSSAESTTELDPLAEPTPEPTRSPIAN